MKIKLSQLRTIIKEEVALQTLRQQVRLHVESALLEQASLEAIDEGWKDKAKNAMLAALTAGTIAGGIKVNSDQLAQVRQNVAIEQAKNEKEADVIKNLLDAVDTVAPGEKAGLVDQIADAAVKGEKWGRSRVLQNVAANRVADVPKSLKGIGGLLIGTAMKDAVKELKSNAELSQVVVRFGDLDDFKTNFKTQLNDIINKAAK